MSRLAVLTPNVGLISETFITRHYREILPGETALIHRESPQHFFGGPSIRLVPDTSFKRGWWPGSFSKKEAPPAASVPMAEFAAPLSIGNAAAFKYFLRRNHIQALLGEYLDFSVGYLDAALQAGVRFYAHAHGRDVSRCLNHPFWRERYQRLNRAHGIITVSEFSRKALLETGIKPDRLHVIPYGVDIPPVCSSRSGDGKTRCLAVGRMVSKKAPIYLLDAFRRASGSNPSLELDYVGDGVLMPAVRQFVDAFRLKVRLHGALSHEKVKKLFSAADLFIQHSVTCPITGDQEGLPVSILEAMAHGLPVISTRHAGIPEAVTDGVTGFLVAEGDTVAMADKMNDLSANVDRRIAMGLAGRERAASEFSWDVQRKSLLNVMGLEPK